MIKKKLNSLYFKWLITKNELEESIPEEQQKLQKKYEIELPGVNVIAKIDLSKFKKR